MEPVRDFSELIRRKPVIPDIALDGAAILIDGPTKGRRHERTARFRYRRKPLRHAKQLPFCRDRDNENIGRFHCIGDGGAIPGETADVAQKTVDLVRDRIGDRTGARDEGEQRCHPAFQDDIGVRLCMGIDLEVQLPPTQRNDPTQRFTVKVCMPIFQPVL